ncbi:50S ribosomal protein L3 N(5)-glutamine methyltransferase [Corticibacter populi]|uniref:50S ribosomal protein L3 N(5)-glutamine methyltransferase n=1 Tax=Corticibacter populi TaxID=1550736 RepID=A0A3M6QZW5_9BURK|nr:50S ribosomal protein L3 N(5)-glutamine methyltransferase [Corticibacter populi]RMX08550.1 50S ribosomal protein L3 N(5)-glutamine methyltransferase [Corticibacter populi]RZS35870.1 [LSU ribosomal protein L3P]-glutamine N5-methyltransferase [Corticibacter populi]
MTSSATIPPVLALVEQAAARLEAAGVQFGHGTDNAFDEAAWLVLWSLGLPLDADLHDDTLPAPSGADRHKALALVEARIASRKPAAYLTGEAWLHGVPFYVDERAIVPRSLIAEPIVDASLDTWLSASTQRVLDLCTGNGSLAVLAALAWPEVHVDAVDISTDALAVAAINVQRHGLAQRIRLIESDGLAGLAGQRYDLILCNPPYVNSQSMAALPAEYRAEPGLALAGGSDGMDFIRPLLQNAAGFMNDGAVLVLEIGHERAHFEHAFPRLPVIWLETAAGSDQVLLIEKTALNTMRA